MDHTVNSIYEQLESICGHSSNELQVLRKEYEAQIPSNLAPPVTYRCRYVIDLEMWAIARAAHRTRNDGFDGWVLRASTSPVRA